MATKWPGQRGPTAYFSLRFIVDNEQDLFFRKKQQSIMKKFVKKEPGEHKEMDAVKETITVFMLPFEGFCQQILPFEGIFLKYSVCSL